MDVIRLRSRAMPVLFCSLGNQRSWTGLLFRADRHKGYGAQAKAAIKCPRRKTEPWLHLSDNDGQKLQSLQWFSADANCLRQSRRGIWHGHHSQTGGAVSKRITRPCQSPRHTPHIHYTNKHLKQSPHNKIGSICGCFVWHSGECYSTLCLCQFHCFIVLCEMTMNLSFTGT